MASLMFSGIMSARNNTAMEQNDRKEYARRRAAYLSQATSNPMYNPKTAEVVNEANRAFDQRQKTSHARNTVLGGTPERELAEQKQNTEAYADIIGNVAAGEQVARDKALENLELNEQKAYEQENQRRIDRNATYANLAANAANALGNLSFGSDSNKPPIPMFAPDGRKLHKRIEGTDGWGYKV